MNRRVPTLPILNDARKKRLVRGLKQRLSDHRGSIESNSEWLAAAQRDIEESFQKASSQLAAEYQAEHDRAMNAWDARREQIYSQCDRVTLAALRTEAKRQQELKDTYERARQQEMKAYQQARQSLDQQYEELKPKPAKQLERIGAILESRRSDADDLIDQFGSIMVDRSVAIPPLQTSSVQSHIPLPDSLPSSMEATQAILATMKDILDRTRRDPLVRWSGSIAPWLIGIVPGGLLGIVLWRFMSHQPYLAIGLTLATLFVVPIALVLALMPRVKHRMLAPYRELLAQSERLVSVSKNGQQMAEAQCRFEQSKMLAEYSDRLKSGELEHRKAVEILDAKLDEDLQRSRNQQSELRTQAASECQRLIQMTDQDQAPRTERLVAMHEQKVLENTRFYNTKRLELDRQQSDRFDRSRVRFETGIQQAQAWLDKQQQWFANRYPDWNSELWRDGDWPRYNDSTMYPIGSCALLIPPHFQSRLPIEFDLLTHGALIIEADPEHRAQATGLVQSLLARAFSSLPMGKLHCTLIDPEGLGKDFAWLMPLADVDPRMIGHRIWTQPAQIVEQLAMLSYQNEEIIQQRLRDRYADVLEYNADAGPMAEPIRLVVWSNFPFGLDEASWKSLCGLLASGGRCGIGVVVTIDPNHPWPVFAERSKVLQAGLHLRLTDIPRVVDTELEAFELHLDPSPSPAMLATIVDHCARAATQAGKIEVPFAALESAEKDLGTGESSDGLAVPLGIAGVGRITSLRLGQGTAQHVLVAGKTGSGKSSLLHTLITSAALKYPPDQLRMVLLDFKKGVEFRIYAQHHLPHAEIIGIESRREFGLSALEYLDRVMHRRGELFRQAGVQDIPSWSRVQPDRTMPRVLVVIDEFQEMFVEDDKLAQQSAMLLDRVVRQGRSFGIHMVLASQTLGGSYSLPRTTLAQMAVRIALQCDGADAMMILGEDNLAAARLRHSGQAIYNDAGGRIESNQPFQVAYLTSEAHRAQLSRIPAADRPNDPSTNLLGRQIIFEGHRPAVWNSDDVERGVDALPSIEAGSLPIVLGESLSIEPTVVRHLARQAGRNFAIVGNDDALAANLISSIVRGWLTFQATFRFPQLYFLDGTRSEDRQSSAIRPWLLSRDFLDRLRDGNPPPIVSDARGVEAMISAVGAELENRMTASDEEMPPNIVLMVANLSRFRELRRADEYSFGASADSASPTPDAAFAKILREGPGLGIHVVCWSDSWGTLARFIPRQGLRDLEVRALMQMSSSDSNQLIDASTANKLEPHAMIYYDETDGKVIKFRPYQQLE